jgi:hypothetical protein
MVLLAGIYSLFLSGRLVIYEGFLGMVYDFFGFEWRKI